MTDRDVPDLTIGDINRVVMAALKGSSLPLEEQKQVFETILTGLCDKRRGQPPTPEPDFFDEEAPQ